MSTPVFHIPIYIRTLRDGSFTVRTLGSHPLSVWGPELEPLLEDLQLALWDKVERLHPASLLSFAHAHNSELLEVEIPEALIPFDPHTRPLPLHLTAVREDLPGRQSLWFPTLDARAWIELEDDATTYAVDLATELLDQLPQHARLDHRRDPRESLSHIEVHAKPAKLELFFGEHAGCKELPVKYEKRSDDEEDEDEVRANKRVHTPTLEEVARPLHKLAKEERLHRAHGRAEDVARILRILSAAAGPLVLIGPRGVGKSVILDEVVHTLATDTAPHVLRNKEVWFADAARLIAGDGFFGSWQKQVFGVIKDCIHADVIWALGEVLPLLDAGRSISSQQNVAELLSPVLSGRQLRVIAESSETDWAQVELRNPGFARRFTPVRIADLPADALEAVLRAIVAEQTDLTIPASATKTVVALARRYSSGLALSGASVGLLQRAMEAARAREATQLDRFDVVQHVCDETGLPPFLVRDDLSLDLDKVRAHFDARILGQSNVIDRMTSLVARIKAGVSDADKPLGSFLFVGPTGVGKTETVKALAALLFGSDERILRFDMSEYAGPDCLDRLVGSDASSGLVSRVRRSPFSIVLLDEVEKAHPSVFDLLLQVLGEARLSDRAGRRADFRNTVVLMTSNLGVDTFRRPSGFGADLQTSLDAHLAKEIERHFRPELVNRIDAVVGFAPLGPEPIAAITHRELTKLRRREGFVSRNIQLELDDDVPAWLAERGVDMLYGARPLKRTLERTLVAPIAADLSAAKRAPTHIQVRTDGDTLAFTSRDDGHKRARQTAFDDVLMGLSRLRFQLGCWQKTELHKTAARKVALIDRLSSSTRFWKDEVEARRLMQEVVTYRELLDVSQALEDQILSLEDLAFESWAGLVADADPDELQLESDEAAAQLTDFGWRVHGAAHGVPDTVTLWLQARTHFCVAEVATMYAKWGLTQGFTVHAMSADEDAKERELHLDELGRGITISRPSVEGVPYRLVFRGRHAFTMLAAEQGDLQLRRRGQDGVVRIQVGAGETAKPAETSQPRALRRIDFDKDVFRDPQLRSQRTAARLFETLHDFLRDRMLASHFGAAAIKGMR